MPKYLIHITCGIPDQGNDDSCFQGQGSCASTFIRQHITMLDPNQMIASTFDVVLNTGCSCEIIKGNVFYNFIV